MEFSHFCLCVKISIYLVIKYELAIRSRLSRLHKAAVELTRQQLQKSVCQAYVAAYVTNKRMKVYAIIDSIYRNFEHAAKVKYDAREISYLGVSYCQEEIQANSRR